MIAIENQTDNSVGFTIEGKISEGEIKAISHLMEEKLKTYDKLRMFVEAKHLQGYESLSAFMEDMKYSLKYWNAIEKAALVADEKWVDGLTNLTDIINAGEIKHFPTAERDIAIQWLNE